MIAGNINDIKNYAFNDSKFYKALEFLRKAVEENLPDGRYEIDGNKLFVNISSYETKDIGGCQYEAHAKYADIQCIISGIERIDFTCFDGAVFTDNRLDSDDIGFFLEKDVLASTVLNKGDFDIFFPYELHKPNISVSDKCRHVKKAVAKVLIAD